MAVSCWWSNGVSVVDAGFLKNLLRVKARIYSKGYLTILWTGIGCFDVLSKDLHIADQ